MKQMKAISCFQEKRDEIPIKTTIADDPTSWNASVAVSTKYCILNIFKAAS